jgi:hypothetical protein
VRSGRTKSTGLRVEVAAGVVRGEVGMKVRWRVVDVQTQAELGVRYESQPVWVIRI